MKEGLQLSPKKSQNMSSPNLQKDKNYIPSRYAQDLHSNKSGLHDILNSIQFHAKTSDLDKGLAPNSPLKLKFSDKKLQLPKNKLINQYRPKPLKREQSDLQNFKEIFLDPRLQVLDSIQQQSKTEQIVFAKQLCKEYEKLLQFENGKVDFSIKTEEVSAKEVEQHFQECIETLNDFQQKDSLFKPEQNFYEEQIRIEPPDLPNSSIASTLSPGLGYAPSIPLSINNNTNKINLAELLMRAKAGMNTDDIQKQAHLSFCLGLVYEEKRQYHQALKFYRRFLGFAKAMEDKIGMALGANRTAINYFYCGDIVKSISFHKQNLKLSDNENCFAAYYNLGICHRNITKFEEALEYFQTGLQWANQNGEAQSQCICLGQLAVTYKCMHLFQKSSQYFEKSANICRKLKKTKLLQENLLNILLIASNLNLKSDHNLLEISLEAYECSKLLEEKRNIELFSCNIGIIQGLEEFTKQAQNHFEPEIESCELIEESKVLTKDSNKTKDFLKQMEGSKL